jgi:ABC-2 type transport system ATP-binding protein
VSVALASLILMTHPAAPEPRPEAHEAPAQAVPPGAQPVVGAPQTTVPALALRGLWKRFGDKVAVAGIDLDVPAGSFFGLVGPNGAGKTTTLSMATGLLRPDAGEVWVQGRSLWADPTAVKRMLGVLPDGVRLFDRLTGAQLITYAGLLRGMDRDTVAERTRDLLATLDLAADADTLVVDYSAGMTKKVALASALIHAPRLLVLDEPFEAVDPVSAANIRQILHSYVATGGTVIVSSHVMDLVQRMCDHVAVVAAGRVLAAGTVDDVRAGSTLEERFVDLVGGRRTGEGLAWLRTS